MKNKKNYRDNCDTCGSYEILSAIIHNGRAKQVCESCEEEFSYYVDHKIAEAKEERIEENEK